MIYSFKQTSLITDNCNVTGQPHLMVVGLWIPPFCSQCHAQFLQPRSRPPQSPVHASKEQSQWTGINQSISQSINQSVINFTVASAAAATARTTKSVTVGQQLQYNIWVGDAGMDNISVSAERMTVNQAQMWGNCLANHKPSSCGLPLRGSLHCVSCSQYRPCSTRLTTGLRLNTHNISMYSMTVKAKDRPLWGHVRPDILAANPSKNIIKQDCLLI